MRFIQIIQKVTLSFFHNIKNFNIMKMGKISALSALFIVATLISVFVFKSYVGSDNTIVEKNQQIILMQKGDLISEVSISGQLKFSTNEDLLFTSPGKISKIHVDENSTVSKGDILATLEDIKITEFLHQDHGWKILTNQDEFYTKIIVNAAGAWCDLIATNVGAKKINIVPKKRTIFCFKPTNIKLNNKWPLGVDVEENFYFKIENDTVIASPADETPTVPHDVQAEDIDIALGIERIKNSTLFEFNSIFNKWAGLRSFVKDKNPVIGFDNKFKNFFWFAGQGGYGIQTAPALSKIASNLILKKSNNYYENEFQINLNLLKINRFYK